eukprot:6396267-Pyramimonas_sp.AAC.1
MPSASEIDTDRRRVLADLGKPQSLSERGGRGSHALACAFWWARRQVRGVCKLRTTGPPVFGLPTRHLLLQHFFVVR